MTSLQSNPLDRRSLPLKARSRTRPLLLLFIALLLIQGQLYIGSTFAGTRLRRASLPSPTLSLRSYADAVWEECAHLLSLGLPDVGDAGRIWLHNAFVGTNIDPAERMQAAAEEQGEGDEERQVASLGERGGTRRGGEGEDAKADKYRCRCLVPEVHAGRQPRVSAIVQSFNHHANIQNISRALKEAGDVEEVVVSEDGSTDGSLHDWKGALPGDGHFIIRSNNLHELRSYNRAMRMSSGDFVVLLQDDDLLPASDAWVQNAMRLFEALPDLGVLGGYIGQLWDHSTGQGYEYGEQVSTHGGLRKGNTKPLEYVEPATGLPFMYAECVWIAPVFIRRSLLRKAGGLELTIAKRGEPGVWQDCVFSYEAWVNGFSVGTYSAKFERGVGGHGSAASTMKVRQRERVYDRAIAYTNRKFPRRRIHDSIVALNSKTLLPRVK